MHAADDPATKSLSSSSNIVALLRKQLVPWIEFRLERSQGSTNRREGMCEDR